MKEKSKKLFDIVSGVIVGIIVVIIFLLVIGRIKNEPVFLFNRSAVFIVSESMEPTIKKNSYILVKKISPKEVSVGDVIVFYSDDPTIKDSLNTHKVVEIKNGGAEFVTRGINNSKDDDYTAKAEKVVGTYVKELPVLSKIFTFFLTKLGLAVMIVLVISVTAVAFLPDLKKKAKNEFKELTPEEREALVKEEIEKIKKQNEAVSNTSEDNENAEKNETEKEN